MRRVIITIVCAATLAAWPAIATAQKPASQFAQVSETFTIEAVDYTLRLVQLKDAAGKTQTIYCGPEVDRFNALKVGDKVTIKYYESVVYAINQPGSAKAGGAAVTRTPGDRPGGTVAQQMTASVTVNAIDTKVPSVTITTKDGQTMSFKVEDPKKLQGVKVGDQVEITYTQALAISVTPAGK
jgi:Cu/Ag efflux protein CusF